MCLKIIRSVKLTSNQSNTYRNVIKQQEDLQTLYSTILTNVSSKINKYKDITDITELLKLLDITLTSLDNTLIDTIFIKIGMIFDNKSNNLDLNTLWMKIAIKVNEYVDSDITDRITKEIITDALTKLSKFAKIIQLTYGLLQKIKNCDSKATYNGKTLRGIRNTLADNQKKIIDKATEIIPIIIRATRHSIRINEFKNISSEIIDNINLLLNIETLHSINNNSKENMYKLFRNAIIELIDDIIKLINNDIKDKRLTHNASYTSYKSLLNELKLRAIKKLTFEILQKHFSGFTVDKETQKFLLNNGKSIYQIIDIKNELEKMVDRIDSPLNDNDKTAFLEIMKRLHNIYQSIDERYNKYFKIMYTNIVNILKNNTDINNYITQLGTVANTYTKKEWMNEQISAEAKVEAEEKAKAEKAKVRATAKVAPEAPKVITQEEKNAIIKALGEKVRAQAAQPQPTNLLYNLFTTNNPDDFKEISAKTENPAYRDMLYRMYDGLQKSGTISGTSIPPPENYYKDGENVYYSCDDIHYKPITIKNFYTFIILDRPFKIISTFDPLSEFDPKNTTKSKYPSILSNPFIISHGVIGNGLIIPNVDYYHWSRTNSTPNPTPSTPPHPISKSFPIQSNIRKLEYSCSDNFLPISINAIFYIKYENNKFENGTINSKQQFNELEGNYKLGVIGTNNGKYHIIYDVDYYNWRIPSNGGSSNGGSRKRKRKTHKTNIRRIKYKTLKRKTRKTNKTRIRHR